ncbi:MAG: hypothetical protein SFZ23_08700 [Planctomycetota bacterium]|nr:hypothetical protein [Planctomycetota bacterium]
MSVTMETIVGSRSTWPAVGTVAERALWNRLFAYRRAEFVPWTSRSTIVYVTVGVAAGGLGTLETPYTVRHLTDLQGLFVSLSALGNDVAVVFDDDIVIPGEAVNTDQSFEVWGGNITIAGRGNGARRAEISGFCAIPAGTPVVVAGPNSRVYSMAGNLRAWWVRARPAGGTRDDYFTQPYTMVGNSTACLATPFSFFSDVDGTLYVNHDSHDADSIEISCTTGEGIKFPNEDSNFLIDLILTGMGMSEYGTGNRVGVLRADVRGTNIFGALRCTLAWGGYHVCAFPIGNAGAGGIGCLFDCRIGYSQVNNFLSGDAHVGYNQDGDHEVYRDGCSQPWGGLPIDVATTGFGLPQPTTPYAHTSSTGGTPPYPTIVIERHCNWSPTSGLPLTSNTMNTSVPTITNPLDQTQFRNYSINRTVTAGGTSPNAFSGRHEGSRLIIQLTVPSGSFAQPFGAGSQVLRGYFTNCDEEYQFLAGTWTGKRCRLFNSMSAHLFFRAHCRRRFTGAAVPVDWQWGTHLGSCKDYNCIESIETGVASTNVEYSSNPFANHMREDDPDVAAGGAKNLAQIGIRATHVDNLPGTITLVAAASWTTPAGVVASCRNAAAVLPAGWACDFDILGQQRQPVQTLRAIGPIESNPVQRAGRVMLPGAGRRMPSLGRRFGGGKP